MLGDDARVLIEHSQAAHFVIQDERIVYANPMFATLIGWPREELIGQPHHVATPPEHLERTRETIARRFAGKVGRPGQMPMVRRDGSRFDARVFATLVSFGGRRAVLVTLDDITELTDALQRASWNAQMLECTETLCRSGSFEITLPEGLVKLSSGLQQLLGLAADAPVCSVDALDWVPPDERDFVAGIWRSAEPGEPFDFQHRVLTTQGQRLTVLHRGRVEQNETGRRRGIALLQDITAQRDAEQRVQELVTHDEVTGLPNCAAFLDKVDAAIVAAGWDEHIVMLLAIDVPRISELRDKMGFGAGDALAMTLAERLQQAASEGEMVARLGSHEFALMVELPAGTAEARSIVLARAHRIRQILEAPVCIHTTETFARCIIGVASFPEDAQRPAELLELAQTARLRATQDAQVVLYKPESNARALHEMRVEALLRQAIVDDELELHYQPQVDLSDGRIAGAEALLRWTSPALGVVSPGEFVAVAERTGLIGPLGDWVLRRACQQIARWRAEGVPPVRIGVNFSPMQLQRRDLAQHVQAILLETGADPALLGVEITESSVMVDVAHAAAVLREIKALGVEVALDDFGTGYSSLSCLRSLPIDVVKIDRSFVHDVTAAPADVSVTRAIITMAHGLQLKVLAEGVESDGQLSLLAANRCDLIQGFRFSAALPPDAFAALLREGRRLPERFVTRVRSTRTLLLVDDETNILSSLKRLLRRDGYTIVTAASAAEGLQRLAECEVDVIVSDQRMPGLTGVEFLRRAKDLYPNTIRMVLSGYTELQSIIDAINEGAIYKFLTKPWDDGLLRGHVAEAFRQKEMADENQRLARQVEAANADYQALNQRLEALLVQQRSEAELLGLVASSARDALEAFPGAVIIIDGDGTLAFVNAEARELLPGVAAELGAPAVDVLPECMTRTGWDTRGAGFVLDLGGRRHRALHRTLQRDGQMPSHILLLTPEIALEAY
ncbi:EAL domain-containing protein [uncultured Azohydromonas sp.]|uniref:EAL domain-containing protein n=1 Tax=uncultured Azohydromonas sp. TaxID=487342 RepID=UPI00263A2BB3|nr:EAL domain-containing protein [uncultured Azohydromonas sp.]